MAQQQSVKEQSPAEQKKKQVNRPGESEKQVVKLNYPVEVYGELYPTLTVRRMKAKDFRQLDTLQEMGGQAAAIAMVALICDADEAVIDELDASDYFAIQEVIAKFFPKALADKLMST